MNKPKLLYIFIQKNNSTNYSFNQFGAYSRYLPSPSLVIDYCLVPLTICVGMLLTFVSINVFLHSRVKSLIYKYLLFNSIFDMITLCIAFLNLFISLFGNKTFAKYAEFFENYFFLYSSSVTLTCSSLTKIALAFERIIKLKSACLCMTGRSSLKWTMSLILLFSMLANFPILIGHHFFVKDKRMATPSLAFMRLKQQNRTELTTVGSFFVINTIVLDVTAFFGVVFVDILLIIVIKLSLNRISKFQRNNRQTIEFETVNDNEDSYDQLNNLGGMRVSADLMNESVSFENISRSPNDSSASSNTQNDHIMPKVVRLPTEKSKNIELAYKCSLSKMIQMYCLIFIFGHIFFTTTSLLIQTQYLSAKHTLSFEKKNLDLFISISLLFLYSSYCGNFFVYYTYNSLFRSVLNGENVNSDDSAVRNLQNSNNINNNEVTVNGFNEEETVAYAAD